MARQKTIAWFVKLDKHKSWEIKAKSNQLYDYINKNKLFKGCEVIIIPSDENKFTIIDTKEELIKDFNDEKELQNWLASIKNKMQECITIHLKG
jgi:hypothetical protein